MAAQAEFFADARKRMVDSQVRPNRVTDPRILSAMRTLPRERFVPAAALSIAYADEDVPLGGGRYLMQPMVFARLLQAVRLQPNERALVVGAGAGYGAAVLAACECRVTALEEDPALLAMGQSLLPELAPGVTIAGGPLSSGWPAHAPYDLILIEGAVPEIPSPLAAQIHRERGRIITAICAPQRVTLAVMAEATPMGLGLTALFDCATPAIPSLQAPPVFAF